MSPNRVFLHAYEEIEFNRKKYSKKPLKSKKYVTRVNVYLEYNSAKDLNKISNELFRGRKFFDQDGLLFGAYVELIKLGTIVKEHINGNSTWIERSVRRD